MSKDIDRKIIRLRKQKKGYKTIATALGVDRDRVRYVCQRQGLAGIMAETEAHERKEKEFKRDFENKFPGFSYHSGFRDRESPFYCKCRICGAVQERNAQVVRPSRDKELQCNNCIETRLKRRELVSAVKRVLKEKERDIRVRISPEVEALQRIANGHRYYIECQECGKTFFSNMDRVTCGRSCGKRRDTRRKEIARRERLRTNGKIDWDISLDVLYEKENGVCHLCGDRCNKDDYTINEEGHFVVGPLYPSIDHVTPVSKGGTHTWGNVRLAHHYCNTIKGEKELKIS
jgi:5-methylcytosine-specific restriction endonuclease McrA